MNSYWKKFYNNEFVTMVLSFSVAAIAWEMAVGLFSIPQWLLPPPTAIVTEIYQSAGYLWQNTLVTIEEILLGFVLACVAGTLLGIVIAYSPVSGGHPISA
jgi:ABC-type nitrate/sulfonate/bicarbonate transport system permease component